MNQKIQRLLNEIETEKEIQILYACESGSRAWGFPSPNSDYDIRFIYVHDPNWYQSIVDRKNTIERMPSALLDASGWDIKKALNLLYKSNASIFEWLQSPFVYRKESSFLLELQELSKDYFLPKKVGYHYLGITKGMLAKEFQENEVKIKKYFYVLRPILAARWAIEKQIAPPILFQDLLVFVKNDKELVEAILALLKKKEKAAENEKLARIAVLDLFITKEMENCEMMLKELPKSENTLEPLNVFYRKWINRQ